MNPFISFRSASAGLLFILVCLFLAAPGIAQTPAKIGYIGLEKQQDCSGERKAAWDFLSRDAGCNPVYLQLPGIAKKRTDLNSFSVLWYHRPDSLELSPAETNPRFISALKNYIVQGGKLLITLDGLRLLPLLGLEPAIPESRNVQATDAGYGRKLGFHSFRSHPVFDSLFGGAYVFAPGQDMPVRQMGWFGDNLPSGKTVAVDWAYITLKEDTKLIAEYTLGKGTVLAVGAYARFAPSNFNKAQLGIFLRNCFRFLQHPDGGMANYWDYSPNRVIPFKSMGDTVPLEKAMSWLPGSESITLTRKYATLNPWDVAGERMLLMGKETGGIDEIWAHPFMALRDYEAGIRFEGNDSIYWLNSQRPEIEVRPESFKRTYRFRRAYLTEIISCHPTDPSAVIHYELRSIGSARLIVKMKSNLRFMWPYSEKVTGEISHDWNAGLNAFIFTDKLHNCTTLVGSNKKPLQHLDGQYDNFHPVIIPPNNDRMVRADSLFYGIPTGKFQAAALAVFDLDASDQLDILVTSSTGGLSEAANQYKLTLLKPEVVQLTSLRYYEKFFDTKLGFATPDKQFNEGYKWAMAGTDRFFVYTPGIGRSLVAGYATTDYGWDGGHKVNGRPGYAWYFGRDGVWSSFAVLDYGDFEKVRSVLDLYGKYQDISGKIYHELTTSGVAHYDAADATPLYIVLAGRYLHFSGDLDFIRQEWPHIRKAVEYCYSTDTDGDGLIENTLVGHGWEEGGALFGTHTTFYLASCWAEALKQAAYIAGALGRTEDFQLFTADANKVLKIMNTDFWNPATNYFFHGKYKDGTYHPEPDVMTAVPLLFSQVPDPVKYTRVLERLASNEFSTDWGVRILGDNSKFFKPESYHQGSVWPLFTGWTSLAEFANSREVQGFSHLMNNLLTYRKWSLGFVPEVLHGNEYKPFGVCAHQCWSETMVVEPALEGMLGLQPDALANSFTISPHFPLDWDSVTVRNIRMADQYYELSMHREPGKTVWIFKRNGNPGRNPVLSLNLPIPPGTTIQKVLVDEVEMPVALRDSKLMVSLSGNSSRVEIFSTGGVSVLPEQQDIQPGFTSAGYRILSEELNGKTYTLKVNGISGSGSEFRIYAPAGFLEIPATCTLISQAGFTYTFSYRFPDTAEKYVTTTLVFTIK